MEYKRITVFSGHYGSGKTNVAVNYAIKLKEEKDKVSIYDLDIVNPYFRTVDALPWLDKFGIELVVSPYAETNVDIPAMNAKSYKMVDDKTSFAVIDLGGDDRGALALGRFSEKIKEENDYDFLIVINKFRPETRTVEDAVTVMREIESTAKIRFTGIVNNSNLGVDTTENDILSGEEFCEKFSKETNLPIKFTTVDRRFYTEELKGKIKNLLPIDLIKYGNW